MDRVRYGALLALLFSSLTFAPLSAQEVLEGPAQVIAGDKIQVQDQQLYLSGVSVPASDVECKLESMTCADYSKAGLSDLIGDRIVACTIEEETQGSLPMATCVINGQDISEVINARGLALMFPENSVALSDSAPSLNGVSVGLLSLQLMKDHASALATGLVSPRDCPIKGNIARRTGNKIYHLPNAAHYKRTLIDLTRGEQWFCSEEDAVAAGFRKAAN